MGLRIRTNIASLRAQRQLAESSQRIVDTSATLASGSRINKAADDAAGMGMNTKMSAHQRSFQQAQRNGQDGVSIVQTAEGGLVETTKMIHRLRELAIQSASDTIGQQERQLIQLEYEALQDEIDRIASTTEFNGTRLLVGSQEFSPDGLYMSNHNESPLEIQVGKDYLPHADSLDNDNPVNIIRIDLSKMETYANKINIGASDNDDRTRVDSREDAQLSISRLDQAMTDVSSYRAYLGSIQNRLDSADNSLAIHRENLAASQSRFADTDFAAAAAELTQNTIIQQAGASVLSQANASPQIALSLLG